LADRRGWSPLAAWSRFRTGLDWALRNRLTWSPAAHERPEDAATDDTREAGWVDRYALGPARDRMTGWRWRRNLAVVEVLEAAASSPAVERFLATASAVRVLDVGSKNFDYVDALHGFWSHSGGPRSVALTGIEVDGHRRYTDFRTRRAWAEHYASFVPGARYLVGDLADHRERYDAITWFFPFVTEYPLRRWGLPTTLFRPQALFDHAWDLLEPGGVMVLVNMNQAEASLQHELLSRRGLAFDDRGVVPGTFGTHGGDQRLTVVAKER
jgi:hypothetical protein